MKILALETTAKAASCAVICDGIPLATAWQATGLTHSRTLLPMVEDMLKNSELSLGDMDAFAVAAGPGSFTGLRIGISAVKGLAWAVNKPCIPVSTLKAMAYPVSHMDGLILCAMDARRQQIYNAIFRAENSALQRLCDDRAIALEAVARELKDVSQPITVVGDGAVLCHNYLTEQGIPARLAPCHLLLQSAVGVGLAAADIGLQAAVDAQALEPVYLRLSQAERERLERMQNSSQ